LHFANARDLTGNGTQAPLLTQPADDLGQLGRLWGLPRLRILCRRRWLIGP
jgi:hypothetical protein